MSAGLMRRGGWSLAIAFLGLSRRTELAAAARRWFDRAAGIDDNGT